jgi:hypothetical protein
MKLLKLDRRHRLFREGWQYGYRFAGYGNNSDDIQKIERLLRDVAGSQYSKDPQWTIFWSKTVHRDYGRLYWIGIRDRELAMMLKLAGLDQ